MAEEIKGNLNKVILLGEQAVGKTNLIKVSVGQEFEPAKLTTNTFSFVEKNYVFQKNTYSFHIWDTIGQERYRALAKHFFLDSKIVIFVYDITRKKTFEELNYWINEVDKVIGINYIKAIVGNKKDLFLQEEVSEEEGKKFAEEQNAIFKLTSAKNDPLTVVKFFESLFQEFIVSNKKRRKTLNENKKITINKKDVKKAKKKKCC